MIDLEEEIKIMDGDGDATLILALYQLEEIADRIKELENDKYILVKAYNELWDETVKLKEKNDE